MSFLVTREITHKSLPKGISYKKPGVIVGALLKKISLKRQAAVCRTSGLFDPTWYLKNYPDVAQAKKDPVEHYLQHGWSEDRNPNPLFFSKWYLASNPDVRNGKVNPLLHFIFDGAWEGRAPNPFFKTDWYLQQHPVCARTRLNPLLHYMRFGKMALKPSSDFEIDRYLSSDERMQDGRETALERIVTNAEKRVLLEGARTLELTRASADYQTIQRSSLFDAEWYQTTYDLNDCTDPLAHFVDSGGRIGYWPNPLFETDWYLGRNADVAATGQNAFVHYLRHGCREGRAPNPLLDPTWFVNRYGHRFDGDPHADGAVLANFLRTTRLSPSPFFDAAWYQDRHADVRAAGQNSLVHYVRRGRGEGRETRALCGGEETCSATAVRLVRHAGGASSNKGGPVALLVTYSADGRLKPDVPAYIGALRRSGVDVVLIVTSDQRKVAIPLDVADECRLIFIRENGGFDFAAWAHVLRDSPELMHSEFVVLANDSMIGPLSESGFRKIIRDVRERPEDVIALRDSHEYNWHLQSYFIAIKRHVMARYEFNEFIGSVLAYPTKDQVIRLCELAFGPRLRAMGMRCAALFPSDRRSANRTIHAWQSLIDEGMPFVKASLLNGEHEAIGGRPAAELVQNWRATIATQRSGEGATEETLWFDLGRSPRRDTGATRVGFYGPWNLANGLGAAGRGYISAFHRTDLDCNFHPILVPWEAHAEVAPKWTVRSFDGPADVAVVHLNPEAWSSHLSKRQQSDIASARWRVGLFVWETSRVPTAWLKTIHDLDALWVPSSYCASVFARYTDLPISVIPHVVDVGCTSPIDPARRSALRTAFGCAPDKRFILFVFDGSSGITRKNPAGLIKAFALSRLASEGWQLVVKSKHLRRSEEGRAIIDLAGQHRSIVLIDAAMEEARLRQLFALCDIYASPHRSEGFGLSIAEAMAMGKNVVATDFGGCRDFHDASCGFPIAATQETLEDDVGPYRRGGAWAQVSETAIAQALVDAATACDRNHGVNEAAIASIRAKLSPTRVGRLITDAIAKLEGG